MKIHVVTKSTFACYYQIIAVFSDKNKAEEVAKYMGYGCCVRSYKVDKTLALIARPPKEDDIKDAQIRSEMDYFCTFMGMDGRILGAWKLLRLNESGGKREEKGTFRTHKDHPKSEDSFWELYWGGYAKNEVKAQWITEGLRRRILQGERPENIDFGKN